MAMENTEKLQRSPKLSFFLPITNISLCIFADVSTTFVSFHFREE